MTNACTDILVVFENVEYQKTFPYFVIIEHVKKNGVYIKNAADWNIQIVSESFLSEMEKGADAIATINRMNLTTWGSDVSVEF